MRHHNAVGLEALDTQPQKGYIAVDLDGTLAHYDKFEGWDKIGAPIPKMVERIKTWLARGIPVKILTARVSAVSVALNEGVTKEQVIGVIKSWCKQYIGVELDVISEKDAFMICLFDDSVVQVDANTGEIIGSLDPFAKRIAEASNPMGNCPTIEKVELDQNTELSSVNDVWLSQDQQNAVCEGILLSGYEKAAPPSDWRGCQYLVYASTNEMPNATQFNFNTAKTKINGIDVTLVVSQFYTPKGWVKFAAKYDGLNFRDLGQVIGSIAYNANSQM